MLRGLLGGYARGRRQTSAATLYLDFLAGLNDSRITYSGGTNGTRVNSAGVIVAATTPRFDYNPVTLAARGLLVEEARTNLLTYSQEFDNAAWTKANATVTTNAITSPDGTANADKLVEALDVAQVHLATQSATIVSGGVYTASFFVKAAERTKGRVAFLVGGAGGVFADFDFSNGTVLIAATAFGGGTAVGQSIESFGNGWYRATVTGSGPAGVSGEARFELLDAAGARSYNGNGTSGMYLWQADLQAGSFPTSCIPTTTAAVTRTADSAVMTGTNFSSWYNQSEGTLVCGYDVNYDSAVSIFPGVANMNDGTTNNRIVVYSRTVDDTNRGSVVTGGAVVADLSVTNIVYGTPQKAAIAYSTNDFAYCANGATVQTDGTGAVPTATQMDIGVLISGANWLNGHIQIIQYFPRRVSNEQLQALTA